MKLTFPFRIHGLLRRTDVERRGAVRYRKYVSETKWHLNENAYSPVRARARLPRRRVLSPISFTCLYMDGPPRSAIRPLAISPANERTNERASVRNNISAAITTWVN